MSAQMIFHTKYKGPSGRHLSCLTRTSMFGHDSKPELNRSIKPRVVNGRTKHKKSNTCK